MPNFKLRGAGKSPFILRKTHETRKREKRQKEHIEVSNVFKFGVYWAYTERHTAIQKLQNLTRDI